MNAKRISSDQLSAKSVPATAARSIRRILVVDDDSGIRHLSSALLKRYGYDVDTASDGAEAWEALDSECYDLLLTDHAMPKMTGVELIKKLRFASKSMPVILMSGTMPTEELSRHPWLQIGAVLCKPYHGGELLATVREVFQANEFNQNLTAPSCSNEQRQASPSTVEFAAAVSAACIAACTVS